jgi:hypothetical protein
MPIRTIENGDFVNQGRDKFNESLGEIPVSFDISNAGNLIIKKHNNQTITVPLKNVFALLSQIAEGLVVGLATPEVAGLVFLVDEEDPDQLDSDSRILTAGQVSRLLAGLGKLTIDQVLKNGNTTTESIRADGGLSRMNFTETANFDGLAVIVRNAVGQPQFVEFTNKEHAKAWLGIQAAVTLLGLANASSSDDLRGTFTKLLNVANADHATALKTLLGISQAASYTFLGLANSETVANLNTVFLRLITEAYSSTITALKLKLGITDSQGGTGGLRLPLTDAEMRQLNDQQHSLYSFVRKGRLPRAEDEPLTDFQTYINKATKEELQSFVNRLKSEGIKLCDCEGESEPGVPALNLTTVAHWEPVTSGGGSTNRAPVLNNGMLDQDLAPNAPRVFYLPANEFTDPDGDALTLTAKKTDGSALPAQIIFTAAQRKFGIIDGYQTPTAILITATDPGGLTAVDDFLLTFQAVPNGKPYIFEEMPDVPIRTAGQHAFALPDDHIRDPDNDPLTLLITQEDGSPLPVWLSYNPSTRTFVKADGYDNVSAAMAVKATDPGGLFVIDTFLIVVQSGTSNVIILSVRRKVIISNGFTRWILYVKTDPQTSFTTGGSLYYRARTLNGGLHDTGFTTWQATLNNQVSVGDYFSQDELNEGFTYLVTENTFTGEDSDATHQVIIELAITQDGANAKQYTFAVTENQAQTISPLYPVV